MLFQDRWFGEFAVGGWGNQGKRGRGEPRGAAHSTLHFNDNSENPYKQSTAREYIYIYIYICTRFFERASNAFGVFQAGRAKALSDHPRHLMLVYIPLSGMPSDALTGA